MQAKRLRNAIIKRGGTAEITARNLRHNPDFHDIKEYELSGELNGYDVHMYLSNPGDPATGGSSFYTVRQVAKRGHNDPFSDYNPGGWTFCNRIADLDWAAR